MKIAEVSKKYDISADTLRYYERVGLIAPVTRNENGLREYGEEECHAIEFVKCMRSAGIPIDKLVVYVSLCREGDCTIEQRRQILEEVREDQLKKFKDMQACIERLEYKIKMYDECILKKEQKLSK